MEFKDAEEGKTAVVLQENGEENNEIERSKVGIMRALVEREDPSAKVVSFFLSVLELIDAYLYINPFCFLGFGFCSEFICLYVQGASSLFKSLFQILLVMFC